MSNFIERLVVKEAVMNFLKKHWGRIVAIGGPLISFLLPSLHAYEASHPKTLVAVAIGAMLALYESTAPKDKQQ